MKEVYDLAYQPHLTNCEAVLVYGDQMNVAETASVPFEADSVRAVMFPDRGVAQDDAIQIWAKLFSGAGPDSYNRNVGSPALQTTAQGVRGESAYNVISQVGRIEIVLSRAPNGVDRGDQVPRLEDVGIAIAEAASLLRKLSSTIHAVRLALVTDLAKNVPPGAEAEEMRAALPGVEFPTGSSDLMYQFNSRRRFEFDGSIAMNRLCTWTIGQAGFVAITPGLTPQVIMRPFVGFRLTSIRPLKL